MTNDYDYTDSVANKCLHRSAGNSFVLKDFISIRLFLKFKCKFIGSPS